MIYYTILHYTTLHYTILYYTILYYTILYYTIDAWPRRVHKCPRRVTPAGDFSSSQKANTSIKGPPPGWTLWWGSASPPSLHTDESWRCVPVAFPLRGRRALRPVLFPRQRREGPPPPRERRDPHASDQLETPLLSVTKLYLFEITWFKHKHRTNNKHL